MERAFFGRNAVRKYRIPRGEAANFADAVNVLHNGPEPEGYEVVVEYMNVFRYSRNGYQIWYEVITEERSIRVIYFEPEPN